MLGRLKQFGLRALDTFENVMAIIGVYLAVCSIRSLWSTEASERYSKKQRIALFFFYLLHITALILATGVFGEFIISASMAVFLVNVTSIINDLYDYVQEYYDNYKRKKELRELEDEIPNHELLFSQNALILKEFVELKDEVDSLNERQHELVLLNSMLDDNASPTPQSCIEKLTKITDMLNKKCQFIVTEQLVIDRYHQKYGFELDEKQIVKDTNAAIQVMQQRKKELQDIIANLKQRHPIPHDDIVAFEHSITSLESSIRKKTIINQHFFKLSQARDVLGDVERQLMNLDARYEQAPFDNVDPTEKEQIKGLERDHLLERDNALRQFIENPIQPIPVSEERAKFDLWSNAQNAIEKLKASQDRETIREILSEQIKTLEHMILEANDKYNKQKKFIQAISSNQRQDIALNFDNIYKSGKKLIDIKREIKLSNLEEKHKLWSTTGSIVSACLSLFGRLVSFRFHALLIEGAIKLVTICGAILSFYARNENIHAQRANRLVAAREREIHDRECAERARLVADPSLRQNCEQMIEKTKKKVNERYPLIRSPQKSDAQPRFTPQANQTFSRNSRLRSPDSPTRRYHRKNNH